MRGETPLSPGQGVLAGKSFFYSRESHAGKRQGLARELLRGSGDTCALHSKRRDQNEGANDG
jgi:hypothetical protein